MDSELQQEQLAETPLAFNVTGSRIIAALIDIALFLLVFLLMAALWGNMGTTSQDNTHNAHAYLNGGPLLLFFLIQFGYFLLFEGLFSATLGKMVMGLKVVDVDGSRVTWAAVLIRNILRIVDGLPVFYLVGLIAVAVNDKKQRIGDLAAKTLVVRSG